MFNTIELVCFVLFASILIIAFVLFVGITKSVSIPYLRSWLSKDKYMALFLDKSHRVKCLSASMKSNVVEASGKPAAAWVKKDYNGSYTLGALKVDILTGDVAHIYDDKYIRALEVIERLGITDEFEACALLTAWQAEKNGLELNAAPILDRLAELPNSEDLDILIPAFGRCKFGELGRWIKLTPENIESWKDGEIEEENLSLYYFDPTNYTFEEVEIQIKYEGYIKKESQKGRTLKLIKGDKLYFGLNKSSNLKNFALFFKLS